MDARLFEVFNVVKSESVLLLDCCGGPGPLLSGAVAVDPALPLEEALLRARRESLEIFGPEDMSCAVVFDGGGGSPDRRDLAAILRGPAGCRRVLCAGREEFFARYPFLLDADVFEASAYPSEILEGSLFLGSVLAVDRQERLDSLGITHVVSVIDRRVAVPARQGHLWCRVADDASEDLVPVMREALPFVADAVAGGGRVLVHCEQGRSRSASVVVAYLMCATGWGAQEALRAVQQQRPAAQPNAGFMQQLHQVDWGSLLARERAARGTIPEKASLAGQVPAQPRQRPGRPQAEPYASQTNCREVYGSF